MLCSLLAVACHGAAPGSSVPPPAPAAAPDSAAPGPEDAADAPLRLVEVAPGIHAALQLPPLRINDSNAVLVVTDAGVVVIDAPQRVAARKWLRARADALATSPRRVLVTTHWHLDHALGGALWRAELEAARTPFEHWGHAGLPPQLATLGQQQLEEHRALRSSQLERGTAIEASGRLGDGTPLTDEQRVQLDGELLELREELDVLAHAELRPPDHLVAEPTTLEVGGLTLELVPVTAHTEADLVVHIPAAHVLVTGDVLDEIPFAGHGRPRRWLRVLERLRALEATTIIPGHGPVLGPAHLERAIALWEALLEQAMLAIQRGETAEQRYGEWATTPEHQALHDALVTDPVGERAFAAFIPGALSRAMADLRGDLDPPEGAR